ncbi:MAG: PEP-CTERM sorting domain-containing protein [Acidobacteria bacterium]|nr:PEP-CTERM sorting domain-containing protein [Acidobacteriota bacterium]
MAWRLAVILFCAGLVCTAPAAGAVIEYPNVTIGVGSYRAFQDTTTTRIWLDLDNLFFTAHTYDSVVALLSGSGYHLATLPEITALQASIPAIPANFPGEAVIVGGNYPGSPYAMGLRSLIWGIFEDGDPADGVSWTWKYDTDVDWNINYSVLARTSILRDAEPSAQDLGAWIVSDGVAQIPEPSTLALMSLGLALVAARARRRA